MFGDDWSIHEFSETEKIEKELSHELSIGRLTARVLAARGYKTAEAASGFLRKEDLEFYNPFLMKDVDRACERLKKAIDEKQSVCVYGDYDVDGVTSTTVLCLYLRSKGVNCSCYIPERLSEGFGLNINSVKKISTYADLIITVDTGITAVEETKYARSLGVDVIITDHHSCRDIIPTASAVVNPRRDDCDYPFKSLAGVGVVFKLICAMEGDTEKVLSEYSDLVAIGTIADVMPIIGENRLIVDRGLRKLARTDRVGLMALLDSAGITEEDSDGVGGNGYRKISTSTVGFAIAPRLNAAGRIASAGKSLELLLENDYEKAEEIANELCEINKKRQETEQTILEDAIKQIGEKSHKGERYSYILSSDDWHQGVVGVVASKISEKYSLPVILFSFDGEVGKGSGRSVKGINLTGILEECSDLLLEYGGHELAAGLSIEKSKLEEFTNRFENLSRREMEGRDLSPAVDVDCEIGFDEITIKNAEELQIMEPFGLSNPVPCFILRDVSVSDIVPMSYDKHIRFRIRQPKTGDEISAVYFGVSHREFPFCQGDVCDVACSLGINEYRGIKTPQVFVKAVRPCAAGIVSINAENDIYLAASKPGDLSLLPERIIPSVDDFRTAFRVIKREIGMERKRLSVRYLQKKIETTENSIIDLCTLRIVLDVMEEFGLCEMVKMRGSDVLEINLVPHSQKVDLDRSEILRELRKRTI